jgi:tripartite-type tricarboxylate transporter receptor subunit TctC
MHFSRRNVLQLSAGAIATTFVSRSASAQAYPNRPVRILVGFPPGGLGDLSVRLPAQALTERLKQQFIIENRPGAATAVATEAVVRSPADGYTLLHLAASSTVNHSMYEKLSFSILNDLTMIAGTLTSPLILVTHPSVAARTVPEIIALAKANPGKVTLGSFGTGTTSHVAGEYFKMSTQVDMVHVPYRGSAPLMTDLMAGQVQCAVDTVTGSLQHIRAGKVRPIAVTTLTRSVFLPEVPSVSEFVPGFEAVAWNGIAGPKGMPDAIVNKLNAEINAVLSDSNFAAKVTELGAEVFRKSPAELKAQVASEVSRWEKVVKAANIKPE